MQGTIVPRSLLADNHIHDCGWQEVERYWETAGIKLLYLVDSVLQCNHIHHCQAAPGIWIDSLNRNTRVSRNLLHDIASTTGAIFYEKVNVLNLIDHNVIYNMSQGSGIYQQDCDQLLIAHNLIQNCAHAGVHMSKNPTKDRLGVCKHNRIINNIITQCPVPFDYYDKENVSDYNILSDMGDDFDLIDWQASGLDTHSTIAPHLDIAINPEDQSMAWSSQTALPMVTRDESLTLDYFGRPYSGDEVTVGPFTEGVSPVCRRLRLKPDE